MPFGSMLEKAKAKANSVKEKTTSVSNEEKEKEKEKTASVSKGTMDKENSVKEKTANASSDALVKAKEKAGNALQKAKAKAGDMTMKASEAAFAKMSEVSENFNKSLPFIQEAGFTISEVEIEMGVPPKMKAHFETTRELSDDEQAEELEKVADNKLLSNLLNALFKAYKIQKTIKMGDLKFKVIVIELGFIPSVTIKFQ